MNKYALAAELDRLQHESFSYFWHEANPENGLVLGKNAKNWPASVAATGLALGSSTHSLPADSNVSWVSSYKWARRHGFDYLYSGHCSRTSCRMSGSIFVASRMPSCATRGLIS